MIWQEQATLVCECGYTMDRDVHASENILMFGSTKRAEWLEQPSAEELVNTSLNTSRLDLQINPLKRKQKANTLKGGSSSLQYLKVHLIEFHLR